MPPGSDDSGRIRGGPLAPVSPIHGEPEGPRGPTTAGAEEFPLPPRRVDPEALRRLVRGRLATHYFESLNRYLAELAIPHPQSGLDVTLRSDRLQYRLQQAGTGGPIEVTASQLRAGSFAEVLRMSYRPDARVASSLNPEPHDDWLRGPEKTHHGILQGMLGQRAESLLWGSELYGRLSRSLGSLEGRYEPETRSVWFERFAVDKGNLFTFALQEAPGGPADPAWHDYFPQLRIFTEHATPSGPERRPFLNLSPNGELNFDPNAMLREVIDPNQKQILGRLSGSLASASGNPQAYQITLSRALDRLPGGTAIRPPVIAPATRIPNNAGTSFGPMGEPILEIHFGLDLLRNFHPFAGHRWENPENRGEVRTLRPPPGLSTVMGTELMRWILGGPYHWIYNAALSEPRSKGDYLRLHLFPRGGGELTIYRKGELFDIITKVQNGKRWRAGEAIQEMELKGQTFENRFQALQAAVARRNAEATGLSPLRVQQAPSLDLERLHLGPDGTPEPIRDTVTAWRRIQALIPPGVEARVLTDLNLRGQLSGVQVDFFASQPATMLKIRQASVPGPDGRSIPRVSVFLESGTERRSMVFQDGTHRPDLSAEALQKNMEQARTGSGRTWLRTAASAGHFYFVRRAAWAVAGGIPYAVGHFASGYLVRPYERWLYTPAEQRFLGSAPPRYTLDYLHNHVLGPYLKMAFFSGLGTVMVDGIYNSVFSRAVLSRQAARAGAMSFSQAWRSTPSSFFNPNPFAQPMRSRLPLRVLQRGIPLVMGLAGPELVANHSLDTAQLGRNLKYAGAAALTSTALTYVMARPNSVLSRAAVRAGLMRSAGFGVRGARFASTFRGNVFLTLVEFTLIGILAAHDRREEMAGIRDGLRSQLGHAIDRKNELITRLARGEEIAPRDLIEADQSFHQAHAAYRRFLEMDEKTSGTGNFQPVGLDNDFLDEYEGFDRQGALASAAPNGQSFGLAGLRSGHEGRLASLRARRQQMERELKALYARHGIPEGEGTSAELSLRDWVRQLAQNGEGTGPGPVSAPRRSPISLDSPEAQAIFEQFRWKAAREPSFVLWSPGRRARYLLQQFRGYQIHESDGSYRPWNLNDALGFLDEVDRAEARRAANFEEPLTLPREREKFNTDGLQRLFAEERAIREREMSSHTHAARHASRLASNVADLDLQMEAYLTLANQRTADALETYLEPAPWVATNS